MNGLRWLGIFTFALVALAACAEHPRAPGGASPLGRWVTASGNLEVEIAPCGDALCGTVVRVLANRSMSREGEPMHAADPRDPLGMQVLLGFTPTRAGERWEGEIYDRENAKTYRCIMTLGAGGELVLRGYVGLPLFGRTQTWQRVSAERTGAPDFTGIDAWLNSAPLSLADLRGKVVLVDFWTYACSNCIATLPQLVRWHERYAQAGLVVVGVHAPELEFERELDGVRAALRRHGIEYPVAIDARFETWNAYRTRAWPTLYLIDREGRIALTHVGEGDYARIERAIEAVLEEPGAG